MEKSLLKKILLILIPLICVILIGVVLANIGIISTEAPQPNSHTVNATLVIDYGNDTVDTYNIELENATVFSILKEASKLYNFTFEAQYFEQYQCHYVTSINSVEEGQDNRYWQFYLNENYGTVGADFQTVKDGDLVEWVFQQPQI
ncbi:MAG: DUF4430 domain-containing protein [Candidatus Thermoplasmatota archaeon]|nr:DUF4430 domain-containing protein [Candidatus Thermoplasmatota archaeon]